MTSTMPSRIARAHPFHALLFAAACGGDDSSTGSGNSSVTVSTSAGEESSSSSASSSNTAATDTSGGSTAADESSGAASSSGADTGTDSGSETGTTATGNTTGGSDDGTSTGGASETTQGVSASSDDDDGGTTQGIDPCQGGGGNGKLEFSYIWIANSNESTVSKIDTQTLVEEARYLTRPDSNGNPSRTSVNLQGDVAVANRNGGVTMIRARLEDCVDGNNTSTGPADVLPWPDGCVAWHTPMNYTTQRPIAWTQGTLDPQTCEYEDPLVWTAGANAGVANSIEVLLLDGETGVVLETVPIPEVPLGSYNLGLYGAAVDGAGDFWASQLDVGHLVRVDLEDLTHESWPMPVVGYGMTVDHLGRPWTCNAQVARFDPMTELWTVGAGEPGAGGAGCMEDGDGTMWVAGYAITAIDVETMELIDTYPMPVINGNPDTGYGRGISIDFDGYVWSPSHWSNAAYRLDPVAGTFDSVTGLNFPYTYSDMTGFALANVDPQ